MYKYKKSETTGLSINQSYEGERIEEKIERIVNNKEAITDGAPAIYTERRDGVRPEYNIRTDRFEVAIEAMDLVDKSYKAKREQRAERAKEAIANRKEGGGEASSVEATNI